MFGLFPTTVEVTHFHLFCGMGGGAVGFNAGAVRVGSLSATARCVGGIDGSAEAVADFSRLAGVPGTCLDLFSAEQYTAWHGKPPPDDWREATADDIRAAVRGGGTPDIVFTSPPCKGFSGLQAPSRARSAKYQALNGLTVRGLWLLLEAFRDDPVPLLILENVPLLAKSGSALLDQIDAMLECAGYAVAHTVHDAGELGGLGQRRKRFLLVARHKAKVPPFLYEAPRRGLRTVGDVIGEMPLPETTGGRLHKLPAMEWRTWVRLALVEAGKDWRSLQRLQVGKDGMVRGLRLVKGDARPLPDPSVTFTSEYAQYGVTEWSQPNGTVTAKAAQGSGAFSVADPRIPGPGWQGRLPFGGTYGVAPMDAPSCTVTAMASPTRGTFAVSDPRLPSERYGNAVRVSEWDEASPTVVSTKGGDQAIADPRLQCDATDRQRRRFNDVYHVVQWDETAGTVTGANGNSRPNIADPRIKAWADGRDTWSGGRHYGVAPLDAHRGVWSVADNRVPLYAPTDKPSKPPVIVSLDRTWHRPFTTLELAALQGFDWELVAFGLAGGSNGRWRERIGNAVPPPAATAIASTMMETLLLARLELSTNLHGAPIWVQPLATALSIQVAGEG